MNSIEIAKIAGVSRSTVSKVLNNYPDVCKETREKVLKIVAKYNYAPDFSASVLAGKNTNTIGLFMTIDNSRPKESLIYNNAFYSSFSNATIDRANSENYFVISCRIDENNGGQAIDRIFREKRIDAGIIIGGNDALIEQIVKFPHPMVIASYDINRLQKKLLRGKLSFIYTDVYSGICQVMEHLISMGYKDIGMITGGTKRGILVDRYKAYEHIMKKYGHKINSEFVINSMLSPKKARDEVEILITKGTLPEAFVCVNDEIALEVMEKLLQYKVRIPEDIAITGFDDISESKYAKPPITTVRTPVYDVANRATQRAIEMIEHPNITYTNDVFGTNLVIRESTKSKIL